MTFISCNVCFVPGNLTVLSVLWFLLFLLIGRGLPSWDWLFYAFYAFYALGILFVHIPLGRVADINIPWPCPWPCHWMGKKMAKPNMWTWKLTVNNFCRLKHKINNFAASSVSTFELVMVLIDTHAFYAFNVWWIYFPREWPIPPMSSWVYIIISRLLGLFHAFSTTFRHVFPKNVLAEIYALFL